MIIKTMRVVTVLAMLLILTVYLNWPPDDRRHRCGRNLVNVYKVLELYIQEHQAVPTDSNGNFSLRVLIESPLNSWWYGCSDQCPGLRGKGNEISGDYFMVKNLPLKAIGKKEGAFIIVCGKAGSHGSMDLISVLFSDGKVQQIQYKRDDPPKNMKEVIEAADAWNLQFQQPKEKVMEVHDGGIKANSIRS